MINVIIPAYNAEKTIARALASLVAQSVQKGKFIVTVVDDASTDDTLKIVETFKQFLPIRIIKLEINEGVGHARQVGLEYNECDFITFLDSDDMLTPFAINAFYREMNIGNPNVLYSDFISQKGKDETLLQGNSSITWFHGKIYRKSFLDEYNIFVPNLRYNEDSGFSTMIQELSEKKAYLPEITYVWTENINSITHNIDFKLQSLPNFIKSIGIAFAHIHKYKELQAQLVFYLQLNNFYSFYMEALFTNRDVTEAKAALVTFFKEFWIESKIRAPYVIEAFSRKNPEGHSFIAAMTPIEWLSEMSGIQYTVEDFKNEEIK